MGDLGALPELDMAVLLPGGPGWTDVQRSLVAMANGTRFEVIVADEASSDATQQLGRQLPWLRIWRSEVNQGFLDTCNGAAALARGELLLLLNNDVLVGDHALDQIAGTFANHPEAGVVGAALWSADGRPQEVGGLVWADGQVWNHGRNTPPEHGFALAYERQCDYVSGCALAIRRQLWSELEGFDPRYRPAYAEDADLCLRVRQAGQAVWVQPAARVLHLEGLSHSRSTEHGLKAHQLRNLEQLKQQWQFTLDTQQPPAGHPWLLAADRGLLGRPLALLLQPSAEAIATCRQRGYGVLALGESSQADVLGLPLGWRDLERWLLEQLPQGEPEVVLVGVLEGEAGALALRLQQARPEWSLVASPAALAPQAEGIRLPALPGWDRRDVRILASSNGLHADGWLETPSRLVIQLEGEGKQADGLRLGLYLPEDAPPAIHPTVEVQLGSAGDALGDGFRQAVQPILNPIVVPCSTRSAEGTLIRHLSAAQWVKPAQARYQGPLLAVLVDLEPLCADDSLVADRWRSQARHGLRSSFELAQC